MLFHNKKKKWIILKARVRSFADPVETAHF